MKLPMPVGTLLLLQWNYNEEYMRVCFDFFVCLP